MKLDLKLMFIGPAISSAVMGVAAFAAYKVISARMGNTVSTLAAVLVGVVVYVIMVFVTRSITGEELSAMPGMGRLRRLFRR